MSRRVIVVGAGISGLAAAWRLKQQGIDVTVLEAEPHVGGKLHSIERDGFRINPAPGSTPAPTSRCSPSSTSSVQHRLSTPPTTVGLVRDGTAHYLRGDGLGALIDFVRTPLLSAKSKLLLLRLVRDAAGRRHRTQDTTTGRRVLISTIGASSPARSGVAAPARPLDD
jgi:protoporphyrinogen/coproporphyrinogen III oxidase